VAFGAVGGLGDAVDRGEVVKFVRRAFDDEAVDGLPVEGEDEKHFSGDFEDEAFAPLFHSCGVRERKGEGLEVGETHQMRLGCVEKGIGQQGFRNRRANQPSNSRSFSSRDSREKGLGRKASGLWAEERRRSRSPSL
jgi:hypothetical protein